MKTLNDTTKNIYSFALHHNQLCSYDHRHHSFRVGATDFDVYYVSGEIEYTFHPEERGDYDTPTKAAWIEVGNIVEICDFELGIENHEMPTQIEIDSCKMGVRQAQVWHQLLIDNLQARIRAVVQEGLEEDCHERVLEEQLQD